jgi:hypothetical protein
MTIEELSKMSVSHRCPSCGRPYHPHGIIGRAKVYKLRKNAQ